MVTYKNAVSILGSEAEVKNQITALVESDQADVVNHPASEEPIAICTPLLPVEL
jgi:hypothetical protein